MKELNSVEFRQLELSRRKSGKFSDGLALGIADNFMNACLGGTVLGNVVDGQKCRCHLVII